MAARIAFATSLTLSVAAEGQPAPVFDQAIRGVTIGPIENAYHPGTGYGSEPYGRTLGESTRWGANFIALTPFGRVGSLEGHGVDPTFEMPAPENEKAVRSAIRMAHASGLKVMLVPHLWVESGEWRALIDPKTDAGWEKWARSYGAFLKRWAKVAEGEHVDLLSVGVELRSWVTTSRAPSFSALIREVRAIYKGPLTYSANWDDVSDTIILGEVDLIGINAFYPLADQDGSPFTKLYEGAKGVRDKVRALGEAWQKPVLFTEIGYTARPNPAIKPWEWPDGMKGVVVDQAAQAEAYRALLAPLLDEPSFAGFFVWRVYADPEDVSQEAEWGFSPRGKRAELEVRAAMGGSFASDRALVRRWHPAGARVGVYPWVGPFR
ncbi:MAG: hypothetical protein U0174_14410 [Polyangiaceae bacterium]